MINVTKTLIQVAIFCLAFSLPALEAKSFNGIFNGVDTLIEENYPLSIFCAPCAGSPAPGATTSTLPSPVYTGQSFTLGYANPCGEDILHTWQKSSDGTLWVNIQGAISQPTYTVSGISATTWYRCLLKCMNGGLGSISTPIKMTFNSGNPPCSGTPNPGGTTCNPPASGNNGSTTFTLGMQNLSTGDGITYQWQMSPTGGTYTNISGATSSTYQASNIKQLTYFRCVVNCSASGKSANSTPLVIPYTNISSQLPKN